MISDLITVAAVTLLCAACTPRPWNFDETDRIAAVMDAREEDPSTEARHRSLLSRDLPDAPLPYTRPVFVRDASESRRRPSSVKGKRASSEAMDVVRSASRPRGARGAVGRVTPRIASK